MTPIQRSHASPFIRPSIQPAIRRLDELSEHALSTELDRCYGHPLAGLGYKRALGHLHGRVYFHPAPEAPLLFRIKGRRACLINEFIRIDEAALRRFVASVFAQFPEVGAVSMRAVHTDARLDDLLHQRYPDRADIVADLPDSTEAYTAALSRATRGTIRARMNRLRREHPDFTWRVDRGDAISMETVRMLARFNRERMKAVGKVSINNAAMEANYKRMVRECDAMLVTVCLGGQVCAGALNVRAGQGCYGSINAFDTRHARHSPGMISAYLSVCAAIEAGVRRFHFGWEPYEYKAHLLGVPQPSWHFEIYRSPMHLAGNAAHALHCVWEDQLRRTKQWMLAPQRRNSTATRLAISTLNSMRSISMEMRRGSLDPD